MKYFLRGMQIGGALLFLAIVSFTILFAEGYEFDVEKGDIVKKSVIIFEKIPEGARVFIDKNEAEVSGVSGFAEFRVTPGFHTVTIAHDGFRPFQKSLFVSEDALVRFPEIFFPSLEIFSVSQELEAPGIFQARSGDTLFFANKKLHFGTSFSAGGETTALHEIPLSTAFDQLLLASENVFIGRTGQRLFRFDREENKLLSAPRELKVRDIAQGADAVYILHENQISRVEENFEIKTFAVLPEESLKIENISDVEDFILFQISGISGSGLVVTNPDGSIVFQEKGTDSAFLDGHELFFTKRGQLIRYDLKTKSAKTQKMLPKTIKWFSRISKSFNFLFLTGDDELIFCDEDFENCEPLMKFQFSFLGNSEDRTSFLFGNGETLKLISFLIYR